MHDESNRVYYLGSDYAPMAGCTQAKTIWEAQGHSLTICSMAEGTDVNPERHEEQCFLAVVAGALCLTGGRPVQVLPGEVVLTARDEVLGGLTEDGTVYARLTLRHDNDIDQRVRSSATFVFRDLVSYLEGCVVRRDIVRDDALLLCVLSLDEGTRIAEHLEPGYSLVTALEGEATISCEDGEHVIRAGETCDFAAGERYSIHANQRFKMLLLLTFA